MVQVIRYCSDCYERHTATRDANSAFFSVRKGRPSQRGTCCIGVPTGQCDTPSAVDRWLARRLRQDQAQGYGPVSGGRSTNGPASTTMTGPLWVSTVPDGHGVLPEATGQRDRIWSPADDSGA